MFLCYGLVKLFSPFSKVLSPFQGILDFERKAGIPTGWINFSIRYHSPNGHWQRLERGEIELNKAFFDGFTEDLHNGNAWHEFHSGFRNQKKRLKNTANPSQLGDHVSLKAEAVNSQPTDQDLGSHPGGVKKSLKDTANLSQLGDQVSLKAEAAHSIPVNKDAASRSRNEGERGQGQPPPLSKLAKDRTVGDLVSLESEDLVRSDQSNKSRAPTSSKAPSASRPSSSEPGGSANCKSPDMPRIDGEKLFWSMMSAAREPDPYVFPALKQLKEQNPRPIIGALSNVVKYPPDHSWSKARESKSGSDPFIFDPESFFDVYVGSADVGMRKPSRDIYELAMEKLNEIDKAKGGQGIKPEEVVFLDDIGENLKTAKQVGMKTINVQLGKTWRAVKELENVLGTELMDDKTRRSKL